MDERLASHSKEVWPLLKALTDKIVAIEGCTDDIQEEKEEKLIKENLQLRMKVERLEKDNKELKEKVERLQEANDVDDTILSSSEMPREEENAFAVPSSPLHARARPAEEVSSPTGKKRKLTNDGDDEQESLFLGDERIAAVISGEADLSDNALMVISQKSRSQQPRDQITELAAVDSAIRSPLADIQIPDSQEDEDSALNTEPHLIPDEKHAEFELELDGKLDLTTHPTRQGPWWPEDFSVNPTVNFGLNQTLEIPKLNNRYLHHALQMQNKSRDLFMQEEALRDFNRIAGPVTPLNPSRTSKKATISAAGLPTPKSPEMALENPRIDPVFKFEMNRNLMYRSRDLLQNIDPKKVRQWLELTDSPPGHERSSFPSSQQIKQDREKALKRSKLIALQRLFQAVYMVEKEKENDGKYSQVGRYIFKEDAFNEAVTRDDFTLDESIFLDSSKV